MNWFHKNKNKYISIQKIYVTQYTHEMSKWTNQAFFNKIKRKIKNIIL